MALVVDNTTGLLPPGKHQVGWPDVEDTFVKRAPNRTQREEIYSALRLWSESAWSLFPGSALWVDGGFVTHKVDAPLDADVVVVAPNGAIPRVVAVAEAENDAWGTAVAAGQEPPKCPTSMRLWGLLTLQGVASNFGGPVPRIQPFGGLIDGFLADAGNQAALAFWEGFWSSVPGQPTQQKGFLEVMP